MTVQPMMAQPGASRIPFKAADLRQIRESGMESLPLFLESVAEQPDTLVALGQVALALLACTVLLDPDDPDAEQWLRLLCRAFTLQAARTIPGEGPGRPEG